VCPWRGGPRTITYRLLSLSGAAATPAPGMASHANQHGGGGGDATGYYAACITKAQRRNGAVGPQVGRMSSSEWFMKGLMWPTYARRGTPQYTIIKLSRHILHGISLNGHFSFFRMSTLNNNARDVFR
jgi:hypothetical protein